MAEDAPSTVHVCLTRCPLQTSEKNVHSLPCRIYFDGSAAVKTYFRPQEGDGNSNGTDPGTDEQDVILDTESMRGSCKKRHAEFRGIQLEGDKLSLKALSFTGLVLEDSGMRQLDGKERIWEVEDHFDELTWWNVPNHATSDTQQLPLVLQQWRDLASAMFPKCRDKHSRPIAEMPNQFLLRQHPRTVCRSVVEELMKGLHRSLKHCEPTFLPVNNIKMGSLPNSDSEFIPIYTT